MAIVPKDGFAKSRAPAPVLPGNVPDPFSAPGMPPIGLADESVVRGSSNYWDDVRDRDIQTQAQLRAAAAGNPTTARQANRVAPFLGLPADTVERTWPKVQSQLLGDQAISAVRDNPLLAGWFADPRNAAAGVDDLKPLGATSSQFNAFNIQSTPWANFAPDRPAMTPAPGANYVMAKPAASPAAFEAGRKEISDAFQSWGKAPDETPLTLGGAFSNIWRNLTDPAFRAKFERDQQRALTIGAAKASANQTAAASLADGWFDRLSSMFGRGSSQFESGLYRVGAALQQWSADNPLPWTSEDERQAAANNARELRARGGFANDAAATIRGETTWKDVKARPFSGNIIPFVAEQGAQSIPGMAAAWVSMPAYAVSNAGQIGENRANNNGREDATIADILWASPAAIASAVLERTGIEGILHSIGTTAAKRVLTAGAGEGVTEFLQSGVEYAGGSLGTDQGFHWSDALDQALQGAVAGFGMGAAFRGVHESIGSTVRRAVELRQAQTGEVLLDKLMTNAADSKLRADDPDAFAQFVAQHAAGTPVENVFIPAEAIRSLYQSSGKDWTDPEDNLFGSFTPDFHEQMNAALASGGDVVVPTAALAAHMSGTPEWEALKGDARLSPGGMSPREAGEIAAAWGDEMDARHEQMLKDTEAERAAMEPRQVVFDQVFSMARQNGFSINAARAYADLYADRYHTRAERLGGEQNAASLFEASMAGIRSEAPALQSYGKGDKLDILINAMQRGAEAPKPKAPSLMTRIIEGGGIHDPGGDIKAMGGDAIERGGHFGRPKKTLVRPHEDGQASMFGEQAGASKSSPDYWAERLAAEGYFPHLAEGERASVNDVLDALSKEIGGKPVYPSEEHSVADETQAHLAQAADDLRNMLQARGLDPDTASKAEIAQAIADEQRSNEVDRGFAQGERGRVDFLSSGKAVITLFEGHDLSTILHESGHLWLEELRADALSSVHGEAAVRLYRAEGDLKASRQGIDTTEGHVWFTTDPEIAAKYASKRGGEVFYLDVAGARARELLKGGETANIPDAEAAGMKRFTDFASERAAASADAERGSLSPDDYIAHVADRVAQLPAPPQPNGKVFADWETVKAWFKREGHEVDDSQPIPAEAHELWARGMERYFMEGKAPSSSLTGAFSSFRAWLLRIYQLVANLGSPIDDGVRHVMDRMIATDSAIAWAIHEADQRLMFDSAAAADMTPQEYRAYRGLLDDSRTEAYDALLFRTMERIRKARTQEYQEEETKVRAEVTEDVGQRPEVRALNIMRGTGGEEYKPLDRTSVEEIAGKEAVKLLPSGRPGHPTVRDKGGISVDLLAELVGFKTGGELVDALIGIEKRRLELVKSQDPRSPIQEAIDNETDSRMADRFGDVFDDGSIEAEALDAIHNDKGAQILAAEVRQLAKKVGNAPTPLEAVKGWAERIVREGRIVDQASAGAVARHQRAEKLASARADKALLDGDMPAAYQAKQKQMIANAMYRAASDAHKAVEVMARRLDKLARAKNLKGMDQDYLDQIHGLLERFDLRKRTEADVKERVNFERWAKEQEEKGIEVFVPPRLTMAGNVNFTRMTYDELTALDDTIASLAHLGREKKSMLLAREQADFDDLVREAQQTAMRLPVRKWSAERNPKKSRIRGLDAMLTKVEFLADQLDDRNPNGVFNRVLVQQATVAANEKERLVHQVVDPLAKLYLSMPKEQQRRLSQRVVVPEFVAQHPETKEIVPTTFMRMELLAVALNTGNKSNMEKMIAGETNILPEMLREAHGWTQSKIMSVLDRELTKADWDFVQAAWDQIDTLWPDIARSEREISGVVPEKVEARAVETAHGTYRGGYYPLVYDPLRSQIAADNYEGDAARLMGQMGRTVATPKGHTIERTSAALPITFSVERVLFNHINRVTTRIAYGRYVRDALKFFNDARIRKIVDEHAGLEYHAQLKPWLQRQVNEATMDTAALAEFDRTMRTFRINATMVGLGLRFTTMVSQVAGWGNSAKEIGPDYMAKGMAETVRNMGSIRDFVFDQSPEMASRAQAYDRDVRAFFQDVNQTGRAGDTGFVGGAAKVSRALKLDKVRGFAFWGIGMIDVYLVAMPTWVGAYRKGLDEGMTVEQARAYGDKAVRRSQGAGRSKDLSAIQAGPEAMKFATMFYSYFNVQYNQQREAIHDVKRGDYRRAAMNVFWVMMAAPLASALLTGDWPREEDEEGWFHWAARKMFFGLFASLPIVRDVAAGAERKLTGQFSGPIEPPIYKAFSEIERPIGDLIAVAKGNEPSKRWVRNAITAPGYFLGLPTGQAGATVQYLHDVATGDQHPKGALDVAQGVYKGPQKDQE